MPLAGLIGGIVGGPMIEHVGRRATILGTAMPFIICESTKSIHFSILRVTCFVFRSISFNRARPKRINGEVGAGAGRTLRRHHIPLSARLPRRDRPARGERHPRPFAHRPGKHW